MNSFQRSIFTLLHALPLDSCRRPAGEGRFILPVLLLGGVLTSPEAVQDGSEDRLFQLLSEVLAMGQLLDTDLTVTLLTPDAAAAWDTLKRRAPYLLYFAAVSCDGTPMLPETSKPDMPETDGTKAVSRPHIAKQSPVVLAQLRLVSGLAGPDTLPGLPGAGAYCIFCTGEDAKNRILCAAARTLWPTAQTVCVQGDGFVQSIRSTFAPVAAQDDRLDQLGFMQHYTYCKHTDPHRSVPDIRKEFESAAYNRTSSLRAAVHFEAKLHSVGIDAADPLEAARQLAQKLDTDPGLVDRFAYLEHNRWVLTMVMDGYSFPEGKIWETIYTVGKVKTTHDETTRLHTALVPCDEKSHLTSKDFDDVKQNIRPDVDDLDRVTLEIYKYCGELVSSRWKGEESRTNEQGKQEKVRTGDSIPTLLKKLSTAVSRLSDDLASAAADQKICKNLAAAAREVHLGNTYGHALFEREWGRLHTRVEACAQRPGAAAANELLDTLKTRMGPLLEYTLRKDFKSFDRFLCKSIPFQMTYRPAFHLAKFLTENTFCNLFSLYDQEPGQVDFFALASSPAEAERLIVHAKKVRAFLSGHHLETAVRFTIFCAAQTAAPPEAAELDLTLRPAAGNGIRSLLCAFLQETRPDYLETSGLGQQALFAAFGAASEARVPMFYMENGQPQSPDGSRLPLAYPHPEKPLSVSALLDMGGECGTTEGDFFDAQLAERPRTKSRKKTAPLYWSVFSAALACADWNYLCESAGRQLAGGTWDALLTLPSDDAGIAQEWAAALDTLEKCGAVTRPETGSLCFQAAFPAMAELLKSSGRVLEAALYYAALGSCRFHDVELGCSFQTSSNGEERPREVDVIACSGKTAYFISCKMGGFLQKNGKLDTKKYQFVLDEIDAAASLFAEGARVVPVLAAPHIPMQNSKGNASDAFLRARKSGVILLGTEDFQNSQALLQALIRLAGGEEAEE